MTEIQRLIMVRNWNQQKANESIGRWRRHFVDNVLMCAYRIKIIEDNLYRAFEEMKEAA